MSGIYPLPGAGENRLLGPFDPALARRLAAAAAGSVRSRWTTPTGRRYVQEPWRYTA